MLWIFLWGVLELSSNLWLSPWRNKYTVLPVFIVEEQLE